MRKYLQEEIPLEVIYSIEEQIFARQLANGNLVMRTACLQSRTQTSTLQITGTLPLVMLTMELARVFFPLQDMTLSLAVGAMMSLQRKKCLDFSSRQLI